MLRKNKTRWNLEIRASIYFDLWNISGHPKVTKVFLPYLDLELEPIDSDGESVSRPEEGLDARHALNVTAIKAGLPPEINPDKVAKEQTIPQLEISGLVADGKPITVTEHAAEWTVIWHTSEENDSVHKYEIWRDLRYNDLIGLAVARAVSSSQQKGRQSKNGVHDVFGND